MFVVVKTMHVMVMAMMEEIRYEYKIYKISVD